MPRNSHGIKAVEARCRPAGEMPHEQDVLRFLNCDYPGKIPYASLKIAGMLSVAGRERRKLHCSPRRSVNVDFRSEFPLPVCLLVLPVIQISACYQHALLPVWGVRAVAVNFFEDTFFDQAINGEKMGFSNSVLHAQSPS